MVKTLRLTFLTSQAKLHSLTIPAPLAGLTATDVQDVMDQIIAKDIFYSNSYGNLVGAHSARLISNETVILFKS